MTRALKGEIPISPHDVSLVRTFTYEGNGMKKMGVRITTATRVWELVSHKSDTDVRKWAELLNSRIRRRVHRPTISTMAEASELQQVSGVRLPVNGYDWP